MNILIRILSVLCLIGSINWGLIGFFGFDLVAALFGTMSVVSRIIYATIGCSAIAVLFLVGFNYRNGMDN